MRITWCPEMPCHGVTCERTRKWYGHATLGMTKSAGTDADKARAVAEFARDIAAARPPGSDGRERLIPSSAEFEIHTMVDPQGGVHWTALYSGDVPPLQMLDQAPAWSEQDAAQAAADAANEAAAAAAAVPRRRAW